MSNMAPRVDRTLFTPIAPPAEITLYFCPACGAQIQGSYNLEPARKKCTKTWHLADPVARKYVGSEALDQAVHLIRGFVYDEYDGESDALSVDATVWLAAFAPKGEQA